MSQDSLDDRRQALEDEFFAKHNKELVEKLKNAALQAASREEIQRLTGIANTEVLDALSALRIGGAATLVMAVYPIIEVAWADGVLDPKERAMVLSLAPQMGLTSDSPAYSYLAHWLDHKPEGHWHGLWAAYVAAVVAKLDAPNRAHLRDTVLGRARVVAEVSGGFMGLMFRVSDAEKKALAKLELAFA
jgi:hypothetical protein